VQCSIREVPVLFNSKTNGKKYAFETIQCWLEKVSPLVVDHSAICRYLVPCQYVRSVVRRLIDYQQVRYLSLQMITRT
jgi:hypothetical protein